MSVSTAISSINSSSNNYIIKPNDSLRSNKSTESTNTSNSANVLSAPAKLSVTRINGKNATVAWSAVSGATSYNVQFRRDGGSGYSATDWKKDPDYSSGTSYVSYEMLNLTYHFRVQAVSAAGVSDWVEVTYANASGVGYVETVTTAVHIHALIHTAAKEATEQAEGNVEYWYCSGCGKYFSDSAATNEITQAQTVIPKKEHAHILTHTAAKAATCIADGNKEYWYCSDCGKYFSDADATTETTLEALTIKALGHSFVDGVCSRCGENDPSYIPETNAVFSTWLSNLDYFDRSGSWKTGETTKDNLGHAHEHSIVPWNNTPRYITYKLNGLYCQLTGVFFQEYENRSEKGLVTLKISGDGKLLWEGSVQGGVDPMEFSIDVTGVKELNLSLSGYYSDLYNTALGDVALWETPAVHNHVLTHIAAKAATATEPGNIEYWYCADCEKYFADGEAKEEITKQSTIIPALGGSEVHFEQQTIYFQGQFDDVPADQWFTANVKSAFELGLMKGNGNGSFNPYGDVSIVEAIVMASRVHSIYYTGEENFRSTASGEIWYQPYLDYAYSNGVISSAYYNADVTQKATRAQFAEIFANALPDEGLSPVNRVADNAIPDVPMSAAYAKYVYRLYRAGILAGSDANGTFHPSTYITRVEAAAIVSRMAESDNRVSLTLG